MNNSLSNLLGPTKEDMGWYADETTLKEGSGYYTFMNLPIDPGVIFIENCTDCRVSMSKLGITGEPRVEAIMTGYKEDETGTIHPGICLDLKQRPKAYGIWKQNPVMDTNREFWYCDNCQSIWTIVSTWWTRVKINGEEKLDMGRLKKRTQAEVRQMSEPEIDPGEQTSEDQTKCPSCKVWRTIEDYSETHIQHVCPKCGAVDLYRK